jgi:hypothetical protein
MAKKKAPRVNVTMIPKGEIFTKPTAAGVERVRFRAIIPMGKQEVERTILAQGRAAREIIDKIVVGQKITLSCVYARMPIDEPAPANDPVSGPKSRKLGAEYLAAVGLPLAA